MSDELIEEALREMLALESVCIRCTSAREGAFEEDPGTVEFVVTVVGEDYHRQGHLEDSDLVDHVRAILGEPTEALHYRGKDYVRDPRSGDWLTERTDRKRRGYHVAEMGSFQLGSDEQSPAWSEDEARRLGLLFGTIIDLSTEFATVAEAQSGEHTIVRLRAEASGSIPFSGLPSQDAFTEEIRASLPPGMREQIEAMLPRIPDAFHHTVELWIDPATLLVQRCEHTQESLKAGSVMHRFHATHAFSRFNEAELPGPLPD